MKLLQIERPSSPPPFRARLKTIPKTQGAALGWFPAALSAPHSPSRRLHTTTRDKPHRLSWRLIGRDRFGVAAFAIYAGLAVVYFGHQLYGSFSTSYIGQGDDPACLIWALAWWPHALASRINPFISHAVLTPYGLNLIWTPSIPLLSGLMFPVTRLSGPIVAHNILCILSPALSAWTAFILLRYLTGQYLPALIGGYVFGFSPYIVTQLLFAHLMLTMAFLIPLLLYLVLLGINQEIATRRFLVLFGLLIAAESLISLEVAATLTVIGSIALGAALAMSDGTLRQRICQLVPSIAIGYGIAAVLLSPLLYAVLAYRMPAGPIWPPAAMSVDLLNFVVPTQTNLPGALARFVQISNRFHLNPGEEDAYLGVPLILVAAHFAYRNWRYLHARLLVTMLLASSVLALGPRLRLLGRITFGLPWKIFLHFPFIDKAAPSRLVMYGFLALTVMLSLWLNDSSVSRKLRTAGAAAIIISLVPNVSGLQWVQHLMMPKFFSTGAYQGYIRPGENLLVLPYYGQSMIWQAQTGMYFHMANGKFGPNPPDLERWPIFTAFSSITEIPDEGEQLKAFLAAHQVMALVIDDRDANAGFWHQLAATLGTTPEEANGISFYPIRAPLLRAYTNVTSSKMEQAFCQERFDTLLLAANGYLNSGRSVSSLTPRVAQEYGFLPPNWVKDDDVRTHNGLWLGPSKEGRVGVGVDGSYTAVAPLIEKYRSYAHEIDFPFPHRFGTKPHIDENAPHLLLMSFDQRALTAAAFLIAKGIAKK